MIDARDPSIFAKSSFAVNRHFPEVVVEIRNTLGSIRSVSHLVLLQLCVKN